MVHGHVKSIAADADYQGGLPVLFKSGNICSMLPICNMIHTCHEIYISFDNSPKTQHLLEAIVKAQCPKSNVFRQQGLCKTRVLI